MADTVAASYSSICSLPCSSSILPHLNTNIHLSKQTPSFPLHAHLFFLTATLLLPSLGGHPTQPRSTIPSNLLICTLMTRSMLTPEHVKALNDLTDNQKPDIIALTETWIRSSTTPAELIDSTPPGYYIFFAPRSYTSNQSKPISFLIKELFVHNPAAHNYSSFEYSSITLKLLLNSHCSTSADHPFITLFSTSLSFLNKSHRFSPTQPLPIINSSSLATSTSMSMTSLISSLLKQSIFLPQL